MALPFFLYLFSASSIVIDSSAVKFFSHTMVLCSLVQYFQRDDTKKKKKKQIFLPHITYCHLDMLLVHVPRVKKITNFYLFSKSDQVRNVFFFLDPVIATYIYTYIPCSLGYVLTIM